MLKQEHGTPFLVTSSGTSPLIATKAAVANTIHYVTDASFSAITTASTWAIVAGSTASASATTLWQGSGSLDHTFSEPLAGNLGGSVYIQTQGTTTLYANLTGFSITAS